MKKTLKIVAATLVLASTITSCQKGNLVSNPNAVNADATVPVSLILNHITATFIRQEEMPFGADAANGVKNAYKAGQYMVSNYDKYWGSNTYDWSYSANAYDILKYTIQLEIQAKAQFGATNNKYLALAKFFRAYAFIWFTQRVGDIPMSQAGDPVNFPTPKYDTQHDVYKNALQLLDDANTTLGVITAAQPNAVFNAGGDIFNITNLQWQKVINTYRLRVLISLSKRATDNADLNIKAQFATIMGNATAYPIMTSNSDNLVYKFNSVNLYPNWASGSNAYNNFLFIGKPVLDITTATADPRTFLLATPVDKVNYTSFASYKGAPTGIPVATLLGSSAYSSFNGFRYFGDKTGANAEPLIFIGYPEMCFNIAEAANLGWFGAATDAKTWYDKGNVAAFANMGLTLNAAVNQSIKVSDVGGATVGNVTTDYATFLSNIAYTPATGLTQILTEKYVALCMNSGWEAFYNYRRTGIPAFATGPANTGYNTAGGTIPRRFIYTSDEAAANSANYKAALSSQFGGTDDGSKDTWLTK